MGYAKENMAYIPSLRWGEEDGEDRLGAERWKRCQKKRRQPVGEKSFFFLFKKINSAFLRARRGGIQ